MKDITLTFATTHKQHILVYKQLICKIIYLILFCSDLFSAFIAYKNSIFKMTLDTHKGEDKLLVTIQQEYKILAE